jgi:hypothetical protein
MKKNEKKPLKLTIEEVENRNIPTFLSESALAVARCTTTTTSTTTCTWGWGGDDGGDTGDVGIG